ncbi:MAG: hypothetical protein P1V35_12005 [Planctomycetota bacterium]|nr:hypothetical protein [Planctomycetota bacterium]
MANAWAPGERDVRHPMDGPDVELRLQRTQAGIRVALRANLVFLDETLGSLREIQHEIAPEEQDDLEQRTLEWLRESNLLRVGDRSLDLRMLDAKWVPADPERIPYFPREGERALTYLDLRLEYAFDSDVDRLTIRWSAFPINPVLAAPGEIDGETAPTIEVKAVLMAGPEERIATLTRQEPSYVWRLPQGQGADHLLPLPAIPMASQGISQTQWMLMALGAVLSSCLLLRHSPARLALALAAVASLFFLGRDALLAPPVDWNTEGAENAFRGLHANLYRAFDFHEPEAVYDALDQSVHGDLLERLYREIHTSLIMEEEEGALCRVETVEIGTLEVSDLTSAEPLRFDALCTWRVLGVVHHWGHSHERLLKWRARFHVEAMQDGWRLTGAEILSKERLPLKPEEPKGSAAIPPTKGRTF